MSPQYGGYANSVHGTQYDPGHWILSSSDTATIFTANGTPIPISRSGCVSLSDNTTLNHHVQYIPTISRNLLSIGKLADQGHIYDSVYLPELLCS